MKSIYTASLFSALCSLAAGLENGLYKIGSEALPSLVLTHAQNPLLFEPPTSDDDKTDIWKVIKGEGENYYTITTYDGNGFINSAPTSGSRCYLGGNPQQYIAEFQGDNKYQLVQSGSGYLLHASEDGSLEISDYDVTPNEVFTFVAVQGK